MAGIPIALGLTLYAPPWLFAVFAGLLAAVCFDELLAMTAAATGGRLLRGAAALAGIVAAAFAWTPGSALLVLIMALTVAMAAIAFTSSLEFSLFRMAVMGFGLLYCGVLPGMWVGLAVHVHGGQAFRQALESARRVEGARERQERSDPWTRGGQITQRLGIDRPGCRVNRNLACLGRPGDASRVGREGCDPPLS